MGFIISGNPIHESIMLQVTMEPIGQFRIHKPFCAESVDTKKGLPTR